MKLLAALPCLPLLAGLARAQGPCAHQLVGFDSFGDGWNGASLDIAVGGTEVVSDFAVSSLFAAADFPAATGDPITATFTSGTFDDEITYELIGGACLRLAQDGPSPAPMLAATGECVAPGMDCPPAAPINDDCANASPISPGTTAFSTLGATTDGAPLDPAVCDLGAFGDEVLHDDVWFCFTAPLDGRFRVSTVGLAGFNTRLAVYEGCAGDDPGDVLECNDDATFPPMAPFESELSFDVELGASYKLRVGTFIGTPGASGALLVEEVLPPGPGDDQCSGDGGDGAGCTPCPCGNDAPAGTLGGCLNSVGTSARLVSAGSTSVTLGDLRFTLRLATPSSFAVLVSGDETAPQNPANPCFGSNSGVQSVTLDGLRCAVGTLVRHGSRATDSSGSAGVTSPGWGPPDGPSGGIPAQAGAISGDGRTFQVIHRETPGTVCQTAQQSSQAIRITLSF